MKEVYARTYSALKAKWPNATCIQPVEGGFKAVVFEPRKVDDNRYTQHTFMDKG